MAEKRKIAKIEYNGETYYFINRNIVDEHYIVPSADIRAEVARAYFSQLDYTRFSIVEAKEFMMAAKDNGVPVMAFNVGQYFLENRNLTPQETKLILPIFISACRNKGDSDLAIAYAEKYLSLSREYCSVALLTSLAAAYCDKGEYHKARAVCNKAYAMQGGGVGYSNELSLVYKRIKVALGEND